MKLWDIFSNSSRVSLLFSNCPSFSFSLITSLTTFSNVFRGNIFKVFLLQLQHYPLTLQLQLLLISV